MFVIRVPPCRCSPQSPLQHPASVQLQHLQAMAMERKVRADKDMGRRREMEQVRVRVRGIHFHTYTHATQGCQACGLMRVGGTCVESKVAPNTTKHKT